MLRHFLSTIILSLLVCTTSIQASAVHARDTSELSQHKSGGDEYIVILSKHPTSSRDVHAAQVLSKLDLSPAHPDVRLLFNNSAFHGFAASMKDHCLGLLANMTDVERVEKSARVTSRLVIPQQTEINVKRDVASERTNTTWGLQRISSTSVGAGSPKDLTYTYTTDSSFPGAGVDIYVVDSGINVEHEVFSGRASMGFSFEADGADHDGHGTHVSGTAAGAVFGVASAARIIGVKVLGDDGSGSTANTIAGMDYVIQQHDRRKAQGQASGFVGSVMSMSWGLSTTSDAVSSAIAAASQAGVHVSLAAGNSADDACKYSPANSGGVNSPAVVTVGSIDINNAVSTFSNTGSCVDIYAPGEQILSSWIGSPLTVNFLSGTSMACPHVSGVMAYLMAQNSSLASDPAALKQTLLATALRGTITNNANALLLNNGFASPDGSKKVKREVEWEGRGNERKPERSLSHFAMRQASKLIDGRFSLVDSTGVSRQRL